MELNICRDAEASGSPEEKSTGQTWPLEARKATQILGETLARKLPSGAILLLSGTLGAGKTTLVQGLAKGLGITEQITSPTFALAQHYPEGKPKLIHLDLYRLEEKSCANELFFQEEEESRVTKALMAIEWPERLSIEIPEAWRLELKYQNKGRIARLSYPRQK